MSDPYYAQSKKDTWQTPPSFINPLSELFGGFDVDPCAGKDTDIARVNYTIEDNGLEQPWFGDVFVNPPFSQKSEWVDKVLEERSNCDSIVLLTPDSTDVISWYHGGVAKSDYRWFKESRMNFVDPGTGEVEKGSTSGTMLSLFGDVPIPALEWLDDRGDLVVPWEAE